MKRNVVRLMLVVAVAVVAQLALSSQAEAKLFGGRNGGGGLFGGRHSGGCGCEQSCEPVCEAAPVCCEPAPTCGCDDGCGHGNRKGRLFGGRRNKGGHGCGCESSCSSGCGGEVVVNGHDHAHSNGTSTPAAPSDPAGGQPAAPAGGAAAPR